MWSMGAFTSRRMVLSLLEGDRREPAPGSPAASHPGLVRPVGIDELVLLGVVARAVALGGRSGLQGQRATVNEPVIPLWNVHR